METLILEGTKDLNVGGGATMAYMNVKAIGNLGGGAH